MMLTKDFFKDNVHIYTFYFVNSVSIIFIGDHIRLKAFLVDFPHPVDCTKNVVDFFVQFLHQFPLNAFKMVMGLSTRGKVCVEYI